MNKENKRKLTKDEKYDITDFLEVDPTMDWETSIEVLQNIRNDIFKQLEDIEIYPSKISKLKEIIKRNYYSSQIQPGQAVGVDAALAIGEPTTQCTLNTFHSAGISAANVTLGVPRFNEILNASKNQKTNMMKIKLLKNYTVLQELRDKCRKIFEEKYIDQCIDSYSIEYCKYNNLDDTEKRWYTAFNVFYNENYKNCTWCIRLKFNKLCMVQYELKMKTVSEIIEKEYKDCFCVFSPDYLSTIDVYIDTSNIDTPSVILENKKRVKRNEEEIVGDRILITEDNKEYFFMKGVALEFILDIKLNGIEGITKTYYRKDPETKEWIVETSGTNMREVMNHPEVDFTHISSNNMWEILGILGIEATRTFLISEITSIISFGGTFIDPSHPTLLADSMTSTGTISSVNRYGIGKGGCGVLTPASFEQSHQIMLDAPVKCIKEDLSTVSAAVIVGKHIGIGTGYMDLYTDYKKIMKIKTSSDVVFKGDEVEEKKKVSLPLTSDSIVKKVEKSQNGLNEITNRLNDIKINSEYIVF